MLIFQISHRRHVLTPRIMMKNILAEHLHNSHWCFGILETGAEHVSANVHYLNGLQKFVPHIDYDLNSDHEKIGGKPQSTSSRTLEHIYSWIARLVVSILAGELLEEVRITTCFNDYHDLMVAARIGKGGYIRQIAGHNTSEDDTRIRYVSWAIFEIYWGITKTMRYRDWGAPHKSSNEDDMRVCIPRRTKACRRFSRYHRRVHCLQGLWVRPLSSWRDRRRREQGMLCCNSEKSGGVPTYECSLLQYWINKMMNVATQARRKHFGDCPPVRVKHFISCSYRDLDFLATHLDGITTATYTAELAKKTQKIVVIVVWCLLLSGDMLDWSMRKISVVLMIKITWIFTGEVSFRVNETCLTSDHNIFMVAPTDRDAHNPILVHLKPSDMIWSEKRAYTPYEMKRRRHQKRKGEREWRPEQLACYWLWWFLSFIIQNMETERTGECILL